MADFITLNLTWMDDRKHEIAGCLETRISDGVLHVYEYTSVTGTLKQEHHYPLANIRHWDKERR